MGTNGERFVIHEQIIIPVMEAAGRRPFRPLLSLPRDRGSDSGSSPQTRPTSPMIAALNGAIVHKSTGWHQGQVEVEPNRLPSLLPPAVHSICRIKTYMKGEHADPWIDEVGMDIETWRDDVGIVCQVCVTNSMSEASAATADNTDYKMTSESGSDDLIALRRALDDAVATGAVVLTSDAQPSFAVSPQATAATSRSGNGGAEEDFEHFEKGGAEEDFFEGKSCCGKRVTSSAGLACVLILSAGLSACSRVCGSQCLSLP